jgi:hypothetical protein
METGAMSPGVLAWWSFLSAVAVLNIVAWSMSLAILRRRRSGMETEAYSLCRLQLLLSAAYVFGCAFRSFLPVFDVPRLTLFDTWLSSVVVGRSVATLAELSFVAQWALMLREAARITGSRFAKAISRSLLPAIAVAEICSWYAVLTTSNLGHVLEEAIWGLSAALLVVSLIATWPRCPTNWRPALVAACAAGSVYVGYMFFVDVPMYWTRWLADEASGRAYLSLTQGLLDITGPSAVSHRWDDWKSEVIWMSLYFSVAVWISISLIHAAARGLCSPIKRS